MTDIQKDFIEYAKMQYGIDVSFEKTDQPDTFESLFGASFKEYDSENESIETLNYDSATAYVDIKEDMFREITIASNLAIAS